MPLYLVPIENGRTVPLEKTILLFGRQSDCDVVLTRSRKVSRRHCCIAQVNNTLVVRDLGSLNGVWVNGQRVRRQTRLEIGDELAVGDVRYEVQEQKPSRRTERRPAGRPGTKPHDLSQEVPVPIPDESEDFRVEPSLPETPDAFPVAENVPDDPDADDDVIPLEDSSEFSDSGSQFPILSD